jgi:hypothetical protein
LPAPNSSAKIGKWGVLERPSRLARLARLAPCPTSSPCLAPAAAHRIRSPFPPSPVGLLRQVAGTARSRSTSASAGISSPCPSCLKRMCLKKRTSPKSDPPCAPARLAATCGKPHFG